MYRVDLERATVDGYVYPPLAALATPIEVTGRNDLRRRRRARHLLWSPLRITDSRFRPVKLFDVNARRQ